MADDTGALGGLLGFFDRGYDPQKAYEGLLSEQPTRDAMMARALAGMASAFGQGAMPSPYKGGTPFLATLGQAAHAAYAGQDELMKARNLAAEQQLHYAQAALAQSNVDLNKILGPANQELIRRSMGGGTDADKPTGPAALLKSGGLDQGATYWTPEGLAALRPTEGKYDQIHYPSGKTPDGTPSSASGAYGYIDPTWQTFAAKAGVDIQRYPRAYMAPPDVQDRVAAITPISHWTGVSNGKPFNAAAQKLATNPAFVMSPGGGASPAAAAAAGAAPAAPPSLLAQVPHYTVFGEPPATEPPPAVSAAAPRPAQPPGVSLNSRGQPISQDLFRDLPGQRIGAAAVAPNPSFAPTSPAIEAARAATAAQFGPGQVPDAAAAAKYAPAAALPPGVPPVTSVPQGTNGIVPRPQSLLGPQPDAPAPAMAAADGPAGGLLGPQIPEAVAALAKQAEPRLSQFAGPGVPTDAPLPPPPSTGGLITGGGARPPIAPVTGPMPGPPTSLLEPPAPPAAPPAPPAAPPTGAPPPFVLPPLPTTMPALPAGGLQPPAPTAAQGMAMGIAGLSALTGRPAAPWVQDLAKMPAQMAMEQYKIYMTNQAAMMSKQYEKQLEIAGAQTISYLTDQGKLPGDITRRTQEQDLILRNELAKMGMTLTVGPDGKPKYAISPEYLAAKAQEAGQNAAVVAEAQQKALTEGERQRKEAELAQMPLRQRNEALSAEYTNSVQKPALNADGARRTLAALSNSLPYFQTGEFADQRLGIAKSWADAVSTLGFKPSEEVQSMIAHGETINKQGNTLGFEMARELGSRESQLVILQAIASNPGLKVSPDGNRQLLQLLDTGLQRDIQKKEFYDQHFLKNHTYEGADGAFRKANPLEASISSIPGLEYKPKTPADIAKYPPNTRYIRADRPGEIFTVPTNGR